MSGQCLLLRTSLFNIRYSVFVFLAPLGAGVSVNDGVAEALPSFSMHLVLLRRNVFAVPVLV